MISSSLKKRWRLSVVRYYERDQTRVPDHARTSSVINRVAEKFPHLEDYNFFNRDNLERIRAALRSQVSPTSKIVERIVRGLEFALDNKIERGVIL